MLEAAELEIKQQASETLYTINTFVERHPGFVEGQIRHRCIQLDSQVLELGDALDELSVLSPKTYKDASDLAQQVLFSVRVHYEFAPKFGFNRLGVRQWGNQLQAVPRP